MHLAEGKHPSTHEEDGTEHCVCLVGGLCVTSMLLLDLGHYMTLSQYI